MPPTVPLPVYGIFLIMALSWAWLSDGVFRGARWPFLYLGALFMVCAAVSCEC